MRGSGTRCDQSLRSSLQLFGKRERRRTLSIIRETDPNSGLHWIRWKEATVWTCSTASQICGA